MGRKQEVSPGSLGLRAKRLIDPPENLFSKTAHCRSSASFGPTRSAVVAQGSGWTDDEVSNNEPTRRGRQTVQVDTIHPIKAIAPVDQELGENGGCLFDIIEIEAEYQVPLVRTP
ncbi:hypothetical protein GCM10009087_13340 [Sphingomonas oligophenolica]|uniref:Uncharacterized protein n=1 Tax=Sphingomonas oligophenolica TaxID=301154 RepID=A0ABU9YBN5_9SPHN